MLSVAWLEPSTASICLYFSCSLLNGRGGIRLLKRRLRKARDWGRDVLTDEFSEFLCDHPELLLLTLLTTSTLRLVYHPQPTFKDTFLLGIAGSSDFHGLPLSCSPLFGVPRCTQFTKRRLYVRLSGAFRPPQLALSLPCLRQRWHFSQGRGDALPPPPSFLSHVRSLPLLRDGDSRQRHEEAVQDTD